MTMGRVNLRLGIPPDIVKKRQQAEMITTHDAAWTPRDGGIFPAVAFHAIHQ